MTKSTATKSTAKTSELATAKDSAIEVTATSLSPINQDTQNALAAFTARPVVAASLSALNATGEGVKLVWAHEQEYHTARLFLWFVFDALKAIFAPLFAVLWSLVNRAYVWSRKPETRAAVSAKWQALKDWAAPKFAYESEADRQVELKLND